MKQSVAVNKPSTKTAYPAVPVRVLLQYSTQKHNTYRDTITGGGTWSRSKSEPVSAVPKQTVTCVLLRMPQSLERYGVTKSRIILKKCAFGNRGAVAWKNCVYSSRHMLKTIKPVT